MAMVRYSPDIPTEEPDLSRTDSPRKGGRISYIPKILGLASSTYSQCGFTVIKILQFIREWNIDARIARSDPKTLTVDFWQFLSDGTSFWPDLT
jgi:hypothetical protein